MATFPWFVLGPSTLLSLWGVVRGRRRPPAAPPAVDLQQFSIDVVIPALNESATIPLCLASIARQTLQPRQIILVDDGSSDNTVEYARAFGEISGIPLKIIQRGSPVGKTPTLKRQARELDSDVELVVDSDTILESDNYIERVVEELYRTPGVGCAFGCVLPLRDKDRLQMHQDKNIKRFFERYPDAVLQLDASWKSRMLRGFTNLYRDVLYMYVQRFVNRGQMVLFGSTINPVGCAVAYRRTYLKKVFDHYEPVFGDNLTNSEDIFIGFALLSCGYRNVQITDVYMRSQEPEATRLPRQFYLWSSSFLQSCYYLDDLVRSPFKVFRRYRHRKLVEKRFAQENGGDSRKNNDLYRQPFGDHVLRRLGRPMGWAVFLSLGEKIFYPTAIVIMIVLGLWEAVSITILAEVIVTTLVLTYVATDHHATYFFKGLAATPIRYMSLFYDWVTVGRFAKDIWISKNTRWRK